MRIAMLQDDWWPRTGGGPVHVKELAIELARSFDHDIDIYTRALEKDGEHFTNQEDFANGCVKVIRLKPCTEYWNPIGRISSLVSPIPKLLRKKYDIIHGHTFLPAVPTQVGGLATNTPTVFTVHGTALNSGVGRDESIFAGLKRRLEHKFVLGFNYNQVISVNNEHISLLKQYHNEVHCIPNGVNLDRFDIDVKRGNNILFLGRLAPKKRVSDLIDAFAQIEMEYLKSDLVIVGTGPKGEELKQQARDLGISDRVKFEGRVPDEAIPQYYSSAGLFVLPSVWEGHPLTLLEAWASGTPVIASRVEGIEEFVQHKKTGYLVEAREPDELADALSLALNHPKKAQKWGRNAQKLVRAEYSWHGVAEQTESLYREIV